MAKEGLFNILNNRVDICQSKVLDLFAGTGNISLEFLSRDCKSVLSVDNHRISIRFLNALMSDIQDDNWSVLNRNAFAFIDTAIEKFDIIFADPPYGLKGVNELPNIIFEKNILEKNGVLIIEHGKETNFSSITQFVEMRKYGGVNFSFFEAVSN